MESILNKIAKYNCWDGKIYDVGYIRDGYISQVKKYLDNKLVKVLIGQRRTGKSYILRQIINYLIEIRKINPKNIFYLNKEYLAFDEIKNSSDLDELLKSYKTYYSLKDKIYIFLDEIQSIENWEQLVNSYSQDFTYDYEIFITGSNSNLLSGELATLLSGRYIEFKIFPFSLYEFAKINKAKIDRKIFLEYLQSGGLPEMFSLKNEDMLRHYIESLKNTIILRDIVERNKIKDVVLLEDIFKFITTNIGNLTSFSSIIKYFKSKKRFTNYETLTSYVGYLTQAFIINETIRYSLKGKQVLTGERKFYLTDLAYKNYLHGFKPGDIGSNLENFVFMELKRMGFEVFVGVLDQLEIDFVAIKNTLTIYLQVAYLLTDPKTIAREFGNLLKIKDNHLKIVISLDDFNLDNYEGILHLAPWEIYKLEKMHNM